MVLRELRAILTDLCATVLNDTLHLLMNQFHAAKTWLFQSPNLPLDQQLKRDLWYEQSWTWTLDSGWTMCALDLMVYVRSQTGLTVAFLMAVKMSSCVRPPRGSTDSKVRPKVSWKM